MIKFFTYILKCFQLYIFLKRFIKRLNFISKFYYDKIIIYLLFDTF